MELIRRPTENERYAIFITYDYSLKKTIVVGYYKLGRIFYYETDYFNNDGFVVGFEASKTYLVKRGVCKLRESFSIMPRRTWSRNPDKDFNFLFRYIDEIEAHKNLSNVYQQKTLQIISTLKDNARIEEFKDKCKVCKDIKRCLLSKKNFEYLKSTSGNKHYHDVLHSIYNSYLYSKNKLDELEPLKKYVGGM
ncbi:MAG: hypothetical protein ACXACR_04870 [Candidatus Hodarchaeales archaeon]